MKLPEFMKKNGIYVHLRRPQEKLEEASKHKYEVVGTTMSTDYEDMATSEEERQVKQLSEVQKLEFKEMKDLMTVQG